MLTREEYRATLRAISNRILGLADFPSYCIYEQEWEYYFQNILLPNLNPRLCKIRIVFMESAPQAAAGLAGNPNYIFDTATIGLPIITERDKYIDQLYKGVCYGNYLPIVAGISKANALTTLAQQNILLIDILSTHGIKLRTGERRKIVSGYGHYCDIQKIENVIALIQQATNIPCIDIMPNFCFSVPPTTAGEIFYEVLPAGFVYFGNVNIGQGHAPSRHAVSDLFARGF